MGSSFSPDPLENTHCSHLFHKNKLTSIRFKMRFAILVMAVLVCGLMADAKPSDKTNDAPECRRLKDAFYDAKSKIKSAIDNAEHAKHRANKAKQKLDVAEW